jgi:hypothetical protein
LDDVAIDCDNAPFCEASPTTSSRRRSSTPRIAEQDARRTLAGFFDPAKTCEDSNCASWDVGAYQGAPCMVCELLEGRTRTPSDTRDIGPRAFL